MPDDVTYTWQDALVLWAEVPCDRGAAAAVLPPGMKLADPPTATVFVADYPFTTFGSVYREAAVLLHCEDGKGPHLHCPWMVVDDDTALILGRELLGFPKKMAEISLEIHEGRAVGTVVRKGAELIRLEGVPTEDESDPPALFDRRFVNVIGSIVGGMSLVEIAAAGERYHSCRRGNGKVILGDSDRDAIGALVPATDATVRLARLDFAATGMHLAPPPLVGEITDDGWTLERFFARLM